MEGKQISQENINLWCECQGRRQKGRWKRPRSPVVQRRFSKVCRWVLEPKSPVREVPSLRIGPVLVFSIPVALIIYYFVMENSSREA